MEDIAQRTGDRLPLDVVDLPGYAVRLHDANIEHPEVVRFVSWYQLERGAGGSGAGDGTAAKVQRIQDAQADGRLPDALPAPLLLLAVQALARMWVTEPVDVLRAIDPDDDADVRREHVRTAVQALLARP